MAVNSVSVQCQEKTSSVSERWSVTEKTVYSVRFRYPLLTADTVYRYEIV